MDDHIEQHGEKPEPEVAEDVGHGKEDDRRRGTLGAYLRRERHDAIGLASHQSTGSGIIEGKPRHGYLIKPPEPHLLHILVISVAGIVDDDIP